MLKIRRRMTYNEGVGVCPVNDGSLSEPRHNDHRPVSRARRGALTATWLLVVLALGAGCRSYLRIEGETSEVVVHGLDVSECPSDWTGDTLPAELQNSLESALTTVFAEVGIQAQSELDRRNAGQADSVKLISLSLQMTQTADATSMQSSFGFLSNLTIFIESAEPGSALPRVQIAQSSFIPDQATVVPLQVAPEVELHPYFSEGARITVEVEPRSCLAHTIPFQGVYVAKVRPRE